MVEPVVQTTTRTIISAAAAARVAKKNGASKVGKDASIAMAKKAEEFLAILTKKAVSAANHAGRKVIRVEDINFVSA